MSSPQSYDNSMPLINYHGSPLRFFSVRPVRISFGRFASRSTTLSLPLLYISASFVLPSQVTDCLRGQCYGQFDAKYVYMLCVTLFEIGSAVCGAAPSMDALIVGRAICGLGGAGMYTGVMTLLTVTTLPHERPIYFGLCGLTWGTGTILGPIIGGAFTDSQAGSAPLDETAE